MRSLDARPAHRTDSHAIASLRYLDQREAAVCADRIGATSECMSADRRSTTSPISAMARPIIVFDVLFRLLRHLYGEKHVTYVRNITDVDDKINDRAVRDYPGMPLNEAIRKVTEKTAAQFASDVAALGSLPPTYEPRATDFVLPRLDGKADMVTSYRAIDCAWSCLRGRRRSPIRCAVDARLRRIVASQARRAATGRTRRC